MRFSKIQKCSLAGSSRVSDSREKERLKKMYEAARQIKRGNIYWVRVDENASGSLERKSRPAVIVSNDKNNAASSVLEVVFLTASIKRLDLPTHTVVLS